MSPSPELHRRMNRDDDLNYRKTIGIENNVEFEDLLQQITKERGQEVMRPVDQDLEQTELIENEKKENLELRNERKKKLDHFRKELRWLSTVYKDVENEVDSI
ncbi:hypothetical protein O0L34_g8275 [Tuta absoluta]|nr:hypothetical protein O0L34_g8275 [Tuta absoluta]